MNELALIQSLIDEAKELSTRDESRTDALQRRAKMIIRRVFGNTSSYLQDLEEISFSPSAVIIGPGRDNTQIFNRAWESGRREMLNLFETMLEELKLFSEPAENKEVQVPEVDVDDRVFVVHGHDQAMKQAVARTLEKLGLEPVILHEQPNKGRTIIEKFIDYAGSSSCAVVLLSPDDMAYSVTEGPSSEKPRARQNVILELGFFIGKLGRGRVFVLYRTADDFEMPSDYAGVLYVPFDGDAGKWRYDLVKELRECGFDVDANKL